MDTLWFVFDGHVATLLRGVLPDESTTLIGPGGDGSALHAGATVEEESLLAAAVDALDGQIDDIPPAPPAEAFADAIAGLLRRRAHRPEDGAARSIRMQMLVVGSGTGGDRLFELLEGTADVLERRYETLRVYVDVFVLLPTLLEHDDAACEAACRTCADGVVRRLGELGQAPADLGLHSLDVWVIGGLTQEGRLFSLGEIAPALGRLLTAGGWRDQLPRSGMTYATLGLKRVGFPRDVVLRRLADHFAQEVFASQRWLDGDRPDLSSMVRVCNRFAEDHVGDIGSRIERDADGSRVVPQITMPDLDAEATLDAITVDFRHAVREELWDRLDELQAKLADNKLRVTRELIADLEHEVEDVLDTMPERAVAARGFLEVLSGDTTDACVGEHSGAGLSVLDSVFGDTLEFLDREARLHEKEDLFHHGWRVQLADLKHQLIAQRGYLVRLWELLEAESKSNGRETDDVARVGRIETKIREARVEISGLEQDVGRYQTYVTEQDLRLADPSYRVRIKDRVVRGYADVLPEFEAEVGEAKQASAATLTRYLAMKDARATAVKRYGWGLAIIVLVVLGMWAAGSVMYLQGIAEHQGIVGVLMTVFDTRLTLAWAVRIGRMMSYAAIIYSIYAAIAIWRLSRLVAAAHAQHEAALRVLRRTLRQLWEHHVRIFDREFEWIKYGDLFDVHTALVKWIRGRVAQLRDFTDEVQAVASRFGRMSLAMKEDALHSYVVDDHWVADRIKAQSGLVATKASGFFDRGPRPFHEYFEEYANDGSISLLHLDLRDTVSREVYPDLYERHVCDHIESRAYDLGKAASETDVLVRLAPDRESRVEQMWLLLGPDTACLRPVTELLQPRGLPVKVDDPEGVTIVRVLYRLEPDDIVSLEA